MAGSGSPESFLREKLGGFSPLNLGNDCLLLGTPFLYFFSFSFGLLWDILLKMPMRINGISVKKVG